MLGALESDDLPEARVGTNPANCLKDDVHLLLVKRELCQVVYVHKTVLGVGSSGPSPPRTAPSRDLDRNVAIGGENVLEDRIDNILCDIEPGEAIGTVEVLEEVRSHHAKVDQGDEKRLAEVHSSPVAGDDLYVRKSQLVELSLDCRCTKGD